MAPSRLSCCSGIRVTDVRPIRHTAGFVSGVVVTMTRPSALTRLARSKVTGPLSAAAVAEPVEPAVAAGVPEVAEAEV